MAHGTAQTICDVICLEENVLIVPSTVPVFMAKRSMLLASQRKIMIVRYVLKVMLMFFCIYLC